MYNLLLLLLMIGINNIQSTDASFCNCVCPNLSGHPHQIPVQQIASHIQLIPHQEQQFVLRQGDSIQQALAQHQAVQNIHLAPRQTFTYVSPYSQLENRQLLEKVLATQTDLRLKIRNEDSTIHNEESSSSNDNQHITATSSTSSSSSTSPASSSNLEDFINSHTKATEEGTNYEDDGKSHEDHHHKKNVHYKFEYAVNDKHSGDVKNQREERHGDVVRGEYSLVEADGNVRTVKYYADWKRGFFAEVHNSKRRH